MKACLAEAGGEGGFGGFKNLGDCVVLLPVIALLTVVPIIAILAVRLFGLAPSADDLWSVAGFAVASAALIGLPALRWAMEHGRTRVVHLGVIGALAGVVAPLIVLVSGIVGQAAHGGY